MSRIMHARYRFLADVLKETTERNRSGQYVRSWTEKVGEIKGSARGILGGGIRVVGSTETWGEDYEDVEWVKMRVGSLTIGDALTIQQVHVIPGEMDGGGPGAFSQVYLDNGLVDEYTGTGQVNRSYRVSNIRRQYPRRGETSEALWTDEHGQPQLFSIVGIQPVFEPFDRMTEWDLLLKGVTGD